MKKIAAILTIMIILAGSIFADNLEKSFNVTIMLSAQVPSFKLGIASDSSVASAGAYYSDPANASSNASSSLSNESIANLLLPNETVEVSFSLRQVANSRLTGTDASYTLSVEATVSNPTSYQMFAVDVEEPAISLVRDTLTTTVNNQPVIVANLSSYGNELTIEYDGFVAASINKPVALGTFSVIWHSNEDAVPGDYKASIKLTVSTT